MLTNKKPKYVFFTPPILSKIQIALSGVPKDQSEIYLKVAANYSLALHTLHYTGIMKLHRLSHHEYLWCWTSYQQQSINVAYGMENNFTSSVPSDDIYEIPNPEFNRTEQIDWVELSQAVYTNSWFDLVKAVMRVKYGSGIRIYGKSVIISDDFHFTDTSYSNVGKADLEHYEQVKIDQLDNSNRIKAFYYSDAVDSNFLENVFKYLNDQKVRLTQLIFENLTNLEFENLLARLGQVSWRLSSLRILGLQLSGSITYQVHNINSCVFEDISPENCQFLFIKCRSVNLHFNDAKQFDISNISGTNNLSLYGKINKICISRPIQPIESIEINTTGETYLDESLLEHIASGTISKLVLVKWISTLTEKHRAYIKLSGIVIDGNTLSPPKIFMD